MTEALHVPVSRRSRREISTTDLPIEQKADIDLGQVSNLDLREPESIQVGDSLDMAYADEIAFGEEPITVRFEQASAEENAPRHIECWVNGKGIELMNNGKWIECGYVPIGDVVIAKRKYVEVLARAKPDRITTKVDDATVENPRNIVQRATHRKHPFAVIEDKSPRGTAWLNKILREQ